MNEVLVVDIGGTKTNLSLVKSENSKIEILSSEIFLTQLKPDLAISQIESVCKKKNIAANALSLSLPGLWDKDGILKESFFLADWIDYPFVSNLAKALNVKNYIWETDVICGALGEASVIDEITNQKSMLYMNLGTGAGAALIKNGKPFKSDSALTLRMQKLVLPYQDELYCGVELISGGTLLEISKYDSIERLYKDYKSGNVEAIDMLSKAQTQLSAWIINLFYLFAPNTIVLGGGLTYDWEVLAEGAVDIANEELEEQPVVILPSKLKEMAPIHGAYINFSQSFSNVIKPR